VLSGRGLCDELITRPEESYRLCCVVVCDLETSRMGASYIYIYDISRLRVKQRPGRDADLSLPSSAVGQERVDLYLYSLYGPYSLYRLSACTRVHFTFTFTQCLA